MKKANNKSTKKSSTKKEAAQKKPGVVATIAQVVINKGPVSKDQILKVLATKFKDHKEAALKATINAQLPGRLSKTMKIKIRRNDDGKYFVK